MRTMLHYFLSSFHRSGKIRGSITTMMVVGLTITVFNLGQVLEVSATTDTAKNITLTPTSPKVTLQYNSSEPSCDSAPCSCGVYVYSPQGTILKTTFLHLQIPPSNEITFINTNNSEEILKLSSIYSVIEPIYLESSQMSITFDNCDSSPYSYIEAEFSFTDQLQDSHVRSSGGAFALSGAYPSVTIQTPNLSSLTNLQAQMHWFITISSAIWIKVDILEMEPGSGNRVCIFDTHDTYGEWVCMTDSVSTTTWYSYDDELRMEFIVSHPGIGFTVKLTLVDHSTWNGQSLTLPACNPTVILQETQTISFVTPFFNQSLENVRFQCRMDFTSRDLSQPASVEYKHFHFPGEVAVYSVESPNLVNLADATGIQVTIVNDSPIVSISPTHEIYVDVNEYVYSGDGCGVMVQPYNFANRGLVPLESFGIAMKLNDSFSSKAFTTLGYPTLPEGVINIWWLFDKVIPGSAIKVDFVDFDIGAAAFFVHVDESPTPIRELTGSTLPDSIYSETQRLTLLLRSNRIPCCKRGIHFNVTVMMRVEITSTSVAVTSGDILEGRSQQLNLEITLSSVAEAGSITGSGLIDVLSFLSANADGSGTRYDTSTSTISNVYGFTGINAGDPASISNLAVTVDLRDRLTCSDFQYVCVQVQRGSSTSIDYLLSGIPNNASLIGCRQVTCRAHLQNTNPLPRTTASNTIPSTTSGPTSTSNNYTIYIALAVVVLLLFFVICIFLCYIRRRDRTESPAAPELLPLPTTCEKREQTTPGTEITPLSQA